MTIEIPHDAHTVFDGGIIKMSLRKVGGIERFATVHHPGAVAIVAHDDDSVYLTKQFRPSVNRHVLELPAGTMEQGEDGVQTAARELEEEVGKHAKNLSLLTTFFSSPGFCDERIMLFHAWNLEDCERNQDPDEDIEVVKWPLADLWKGLAAADTAKTKIGLMYLMNVLDPLAV